ncbi:MAG: IclR family transcriptional regulator [Kineosporiaceae bacterium]
MTTVPAARHAVAVLRFLAAQAGPVPAAAIARELGLPRSSVYQLLEALTEHALVVHLPEERRYGLGPGSFELGSAYSRQAPLARLARPVLARLVDRLHESAHLVVLHGREVFYVVEERAPGRPVLVTDVGVRLPAHLTASGRAILAALPAAQVRALFPDAAAFTDRTGLGPQTVRQLRAVLAGVRGRGFAIEDGEVTRGFASVAAAVTDHSGHPIAAVALTYPVDQHPYSRPSTTDTGAAATEEKHDAGTHPMVGPDRWVPAVLAAAAELTRRVGGTPRRT